MGQFSAYQNRHELRVEKDVLESFIPLMLTEHEPEICKHFGCGSRLTPQEQLYGNLCIVHSISTIKPNPTNFVVYP